MIRLLCLASICCAAPAQQTPAESLIEAGHWKRARVLVEARVRRAPDDPLAHFLLSQIRNAFGDRKSPLPLAEKAVRLEPATATYHRQVAEVLGVMAQHANPIRQLLLARRFHSEIHLALSLDPRDRQALRDLVEFYLVAPTIAGGDMKKAEETARRLVEVHAAEGFLAHARIAVARKDLAGAEAALRKAAAIQPASYKAIMALARFHGIDGRIDVPAAEAAARDARKLDASRVDAYELLAALYASRRQWLELEGTLAETTVHSSDDLVPFYRAAERLAGGPHSDRAERYLRAYLSQEPEGNQPTLADATSLLKRCQASPLSSGSAHAK